RPVPGFLWHADVRDQRHDAAQGSHDLGCARAASPGSAEIMLGRSLGLAVLCLSVAALPAAAKPGVRAAQSVDWTRTFSQSADGGFRMGNPEAKIAIVEYGSLTCSHCRHFAETAYKPLISEYVRTGK